MARLSISTIIPVYNAARFIEKAVESVLHIITVKEIILIEDGSIDDSLRICQRLEREHSKINLYTHPENVNLGRSASRNVGLEHASCDLISFLDADDYYLEHRFDLAIDLLTSNPKIDGVYEAIGSEFYTKESRRIYLEINRETELTMVNYKIAPEALFETLVTGDDTGWFSLDGLTLRRNSVGDRFRFDTTLEQSEDSDFIYSIAQELLLMPGNLNRPVANRGVHDSNGIFNTDIVRISRAKLFNKWMRKSDLNNWSRKVNSSFIQAAFLSEYGLKVNLNIGYRTIHYIKLFFKFCLISTKHIVPLFLLTLYLFYLKITNLPKSFLK